MHPYVLGFKESDRTKISIVGGKGAHLGELSKIAGIHVPDGFCITTDAYARTIARIPDFNRLLKQLSLLKAEDVEKIRAISTAIRDAIEAAPIGKDIEEAVVYYLARFGDNDAFAVRSSATAEDGEAVSFAGQLDTYLNISGTELILKHIRKCWASLFTERAVIYRMQNGFNHHKVYVSAVIQKMVFPEAAGIMFTADPVTGNRKIVSIDASFGLGEALVSGLVNADNYKVHNGKILDKKILTKKLAIYARKEGGTEQKEIGADQQNAQALTDGQIVQLEHMGRKIEKHFGSPQDIEWCLSDETFFIVQSRPITTLYPVPEVNDGENHLYISVGHQQMMTDAMKPFGISFWKLTAGRPMSVAGGRLFVDVVEDLASPAKRDILVNVLGKSDPLIKGALTAILERKNFIRTIPGEKKEGDSAESNKAVPSPDFQTLQDYDSQVIADLIKQNKASIESLKQDIQKKSGSGLIDFILEDIPQLKKALTNPHIFGAIMTAMNAASWINEYMNKWLGEKNAADVLSQSVPNNVTSEMGLELLDVADVIRPYPEIIEYLHHVQDDNFLDELVKFNGGKEVQSAINAFLHKYGMRCAGEIDITKTRWSEKPSILIPMILSNIKNFEPGASKRKFEQGLQEALSKEQDLLNRLKKLPDGEQKAAETKRMISLVRNLAGYREYPKYGMISRYLIYKQALLKEADHLVSEGVFHEKEDMYYLTLEEFQEVVHTRTLDYHIINKRKDEYRSFKKLTPPRVMTSDGEIVATKYDRENLPAHAIVGLAVSSGVIEGRARVIVRMEEANLEDGDILVTAFTDPSWTTLFVSIKGLVTEVGGLMTHGAVIAREYGLPAVVGVENATKLIKDGQQIRVHGTEGYVEIL